MACTVLTYVPVAGRRGSPEQRRSARGTALGAGGRSAAQHWSGTDVLLVIDNYDSFTWNLVQLFGELGAEPLVRRNDELSIDDIARLDARGIVISPGPCTPAEAGVSVECIRCFAGRLPVLGVCLGHQSIGAAFGARVVEAQRMMHGKTSPIAHTGRAMFEGLASPLRVARYHSLEIEPASLPDVLEIMAWTDEAGREGEIQAVRHRGHETVWGVQFHPESIASEGGRVLARNFLEQCVS